MSRISRGVRLHRNEALPDERLMRSRTRCGVADHVEAEDARRAAVGQQERGQDREQRGLAGAVRPQHPEDRAARDDERHAPQGGLKPPSRPSRAKRLAEVADFDRGLGRRHAIHRIIRAMSDLQAWSAPAADVPPGTSAKFPAELARREGRGLRRQLRRPLPRLREPVRARGHAARLVAERVLHRRRPAARLRHARRPLRAGQRTLRGRARAAARLSGPSRCGSRTTR